MGRKRIQGIDKIRVMAGLGLCSATVIGLCYLIDFKGGIQLGFFGLIVCFAWFANQGERTSGQSNRPSDYTDLSDGGDCD